MTIRLRCGLAALFLSLTCISIGALSPAHAHPEDAFCTYDSGVDPALCRALQELDRPADADGSPGAVPEELMAVAADSLDRSWGETVLVYLRVGVFHILPSSLLNLPGILGAGWDHILFVLALFLTSQRLRPLLLQISAFTVAHTVTLGLAASGVISPAGYIVEPLIAATIAFVALENTVFKDMQVWRPFIVFAFGLIHGMGFAGFFGELGLPDSMFWTALISFNVGVEIGQLSVILVALILTLLARRMLPVLGTDEGYRKGIVIPLSLLIGAIGIWWTIQRIFLGG